MDPTTDPVKATKPDAPRKASFAIELILVSHVLALGELTIGLDVGLRPEGEKPGKFFASTTPFKGFSKYSK